jgi:translocator protein
VALAVTGLLFQLICVACFALVLLHAFSRSIGTGFMVLLIPIYNVVYGFSQFEHRRKGWILAGWLGGFVLAVVLRTLSLIRG